MTIDSVNEKKVRRDRGDLGLKWLTKFIWKCKTR